MSDDKEKQGQENPEEHEGGKKDSDRELEDILGQLKETDETRSGNEKSESEQDEESSGKASGKEEKPEPEGIEGILESISEKPDEEPVEELNPFQRIILVFTDPVRLFRYLRVKPNILLPIMITIIISMITGFLVYDMAIDHRINQIEKNEKIPSDRKDLMIDQMAQAKQTPRKIISTLVIAPVSILIIFSIVTAIFLLIGNVFLGGKSNFKKIFSVYSYSYLIPIVLGSIIKVPIMLSKGSMEVDLSPAIILPMIEQGTALFRFISSFDLFTVWFLIVFGIGFATIYRFSKLKGLLSVSIAWLLFVLVFKVWLAGVFGGILG